MALPLAELGTALSQLVSTLSDSTTTTISTNVSESAFPGLKCNDVYTNDVLWIAINNCQPKFFLWLQPFSKQINCA